MLYFDTKKRNFVRLENRRKLSTDEIEISQAILDDSSVSFEFTDRRIEKAYLATIMGFQFVYIRHLELFSQGWGDDCYSIMMISEPAPEGFQRSYHNLPVHEVVTTYD